MRYKIVICVSRPKSFLPEAQPRLENRRGQKVLFSRSAHKNFKAIARTTKQKISLEKLQ
jgi:hypothetical protein